MKTLTCFSLMAFLILLGCSKVDNDSAAKPDGNQLKAAPINGSVSHYTSGGYFFPLICDGVEIDYLSGNLDFHCTMHYTDGKIVWMIHHYNGFLKRESTGEVFTINETDKINNVVNEYTFHANVKGDQGSHYILSGGGLNVAPWTFWIDKAICPGNN